MNELERGAQLGRYQENVDSALTELDAQEVLRRIWQHDHTVWQPDPDEISNRLGWLDITDRMRAERSTLQALVGQVRRAGYERALLLGMGGSSLAAEVLSKTFGAAPGHLPLAILDSTDPGAVLAQRERLDPARSLLIVATKSGRTVETISFFKHFYNWLAQELGPEQAGRHLVAITDPGSRLVDLADQHGFRATLLNDPNIGGRYSALSLFGLLPAALLGIDVERLLQNTQTMVERCGPNVAAAENPAAWLGTVLGELARAGRDKLTLVLSPAIASLGDWLEQLVAESTGKEGKGILPVVGEPLGPPEVYGRDRLFVHLHLKEDEQHQTSLQRLQSAGHPVLHIALNHLYDLGGQFFLWELATAVAGQRLGIHPFNQPNVESAKIQARRMVAAYKESGALPPAAAVPPDPTALEAFLDRAQPGAYVSLQAYLQPTEETSTALETLRRHIRDRYKLATSSDYGPRFLHSTGQLHKGDAGRGLFIQFSAEDRQDVPIPDETGRIESSISFGLLKRAQALGDRQALLDAGRQVLRVELGQDVLDGLAALGRI
ncbi:MAG: glucose-6-phosphate isomerase [Chloroflexia bacterium]|nr:glucose-6-phosphate isomerase [Chloroflexia bacterium]